MWTITRFCCDSARLSATANCVLDENGPNVYKRAVVEKNEDNGDTKLSARLPPELEERFERWRQSSPLKHASRSAAIRFVIEAGLDQLAPKAAKAART